jgi:hypothetical protein
MPLQSGGSLSLPAWGETAEDSDNFPGISVFQGRNRVGIRRGAPALRRLSAFAPASVLRTQFSFYPGILFVGDRLLASVGSPLCKATEEWHLSSSGVAMRLHPPRGRIARIKRGVSCRPVQTFPVGPPSDKFFLDCLGSPPTKILGGTVLRGPPRDGIEKGALATAPAATHRWGGFAKRFAADLSERWIGSRRQGCR